MSLPTHPLALNWALFFQLSIGWGCRGGVLALIDPRNIKTVTKGTRRFLQYNTVADKNHQGKISDCHFPPDLLIMENKEDLDRCPVYLFDRMMSLRPERAPEDRLFLKPLAIGRTATCWYASSVVGEQTVRKYASSICEAAGIPKRTNQFGRRTLITRMHASGIPLDDICQFTGHGNVVSLKSYLGITDERLAEKVKAVQRLEMRPVQVERVTKRRKTTKKTMEDSVEEEEEEETITLSQQVRLMPQTASLPSGSVFNNCTFTFNITRN
jgi:hypothetical protein